MPEDFARFLSADRKLDDTAIGFGLVLVGIGHLRINPTNSDHLDLCRQLGSVALSGSP